MKQRCMKLFRNEISFVKTLDLQICKRYNIITNTKKETLEMKEFQNRVKKLMERDNLSQRELAVRSGISESSISRYLSGELKPRMDILANIAKVFGVTTSYLMGEERISKDIDAYEETLCVVTRNKTKLNDQQKAKLVKILFGGK